MSRTSYLGSICFPLLIRARSTRRFEGDIQVTTTVSCCCCWCGWCGRPSCSWWKIGTGSFIMVLATKYPLQRKSWKSAKKKEKDGSQFWQQKRHSKAPPVFLTRYTGRHRALHEVGSWHSLRIVNWVYSVCRLRCCVQDMVHLLSLQLQVVYRKVNSVCRYRRCLYNIQCNYKACNYGLYIVMCTQLTDTVCTSWRK